MLRYCHCRRADHKTTFAMLVPSAWNLGHCERWRTSMRNLLIALAGVLMAAPAVAQSDHDLARIKTERAAEMASQPEVAAVILGPSNGDALGIHVIQGGVYEPSVFPSESWLEVACLHDDLTQKYSRTKHGSSLVRVHAILYDKDGDEFLDTVDTTATDEGICSVDNTVDYTFIEFARTEEIGRVLLFFAPGTTQSIEASEFTYRIFPK